MHRTLSYTQIELDRKRGAVKVALQSHDWIAVASGMRIENSVMEARHAVNEAAWLTQEENKTTKLSQRLEVTEAQQENINNTDNVDASNEEEQQLW